MTRSIASTLSVLLLSAPSLAQTTWYVDVNGVPPGSGTQLDPYTSLQAAIAQPATVAGDTLLVAPGTYVELIDFLGKDVTVRSTDGAASTVLDGALAGRVVTFQAGESAAAVLDGFTVRNGRALPATSFGGGIGCFGASPTLVNLVVRDNQAGNGGGVSFQGGSSATLSDSVIRDNGLLGCCAGRGGGIEASCDSSPVVSDCTILGNDGSVDGGGVCGAGLYLRCTIVQNNAFYGGGVNGGGCNPELRECLIEANGTSGAFEFGPAGGVYGPADLYDCTIRNNVARLKGGGAYGATLYGCTVESNQCSASSGATAPEGGGTWSCTLFDTVVVDNTAVGSGVLSGHGGGVFGGTATRCRIEGNTASGQAPFGQAQGGGAYGATLVECEVVGNDATNPAGSNPTQGGGAWGCTSTRTIFEGNFAEVGAGAYGGSLFHCNVAGNVASVSEGGVAAAASVRSSIVRGNVPLAISAGSVTFSDVEGGHPGTGNFDADPLWWNGTYELRAGSPCIDAGDPTSPLDLDGSIADVGARPYDPTFAPGTQGFCYGNATDCPCANGGSGDGGCDLPQATGGVALTIEGFAPDFAGGGTASFVGAGYPAGGSPASILIRSPAAATPPVVLGDGLRCIAAGGLVRLGAVSAGGGTSQHAIGHGAGPGTFMYQLWFRSTPSSFCTPAAFNLSNGLAVSWP